MNIIDKMVFMNKYEYGIDLPDNEAIELAELQLKDLERKGCTLESIDECHGCSVTKNGSKCPLCDWEKRHPEYANDELAMRIEFLMNKSTNLFKTKMKTEVLTKFKDFKNKLDLKEIIVSLEHEVDIILEIAKKLKMKIDASDEEQLALLAGVNKAINNINGGMFGAILQKAARFDE